MSIEVPLAKPEWPTVDQDTGALLVDLLVKYLSPLRALRDITEIPDLYEHFTVGFNSTMAAIEDSEKPLYCVFVCRSDLPPEICAPIALASSALNFKLVQLPKGALARLSESTGSKSSGVIGVRDGLGDSKLVGLLANIGEATTNWAYGPAKLKSKNRPAKRKA